ncbi:MAG: cobalamin-dependent protein [Ignavibacteriales bacterium]|nr:cobalamin-dependent protein [Ignavibacteriales bacterium]
MSEYLSTVQVSMLLNVNESTVKRWSDSGSLHCHRTKGGHRKYLLKDVVSFLEIHKCADIHGLDTETLKRALERPVAAAPSHILHREEFLHALLAGDRKESFRILSLLLTRQMPLTEIYDSVLMEAMTEIGRMWVEKKIGIDREHLASNTAIHAVSRLQSSVPVKPAVAKVALCACLEGEQHELGIICIGNIIESEGWTNFFLGANVPLESLTDAIESYTPDLVCISSTVARSKSKTLKDCLAIAETAKRTKADVIFGGRTMMDSRLRRQLALTTAPPNTTALVRYLKTLSR